MISKSKIKYIRSLELKKKRKEDHVFVAEGPKVVGELLQARQALTIVATQEWIRRQAEPPTCHELLEVSQEELRKTSLLQHPQEVLAVFRCFEEDTVSSPPLHQLSLALDGVQDPGNLGTIIRLADWFGISNIYCSHETADIYNPKVVQATMGSIARVRVTYTNLPLLLDSLPPTFPIYGTSLDGNNIYKESLTQHGMIVMGNEGKGISTGVRRYIQKRLLIPSYPTEATTVESLNVAIATAIVCAEFRRITL